MPTFSDLEVMRRRRRAAARRLSATYRELVERAVAASDAKKLAGQIDEGTEVEVLDERTTTAADTYAAAFADEVRKTGAAVAAALAGFQAFLLAKQEDPVSLSLFSFDPDAPDVTAAIAASTGSLRQQCTDSQLGALSRVRRVGRELAERAEQVAGGFGAGVGIVEFELGLAKRASRSGVAAARNVRGAVGLNDSAVAAVASYQEALERRSKAALRRRLRDRRFDREVRRSSREDVALSTEQVARMVGRYRDRLVIFRSRVCGTTSAVRAVHLGQRLAYQQAIDRGLIDPERIRRVWHRDRNATATGRHSSLDGQKVGFDDLFASGSGSELLFPGDLSAPAEDVIGCGCVLETRVPL